MKSIFCGREPEMAQLWHEWNLATEPQGHPQVLVILADNGLGKTRLVQEFYGRLSTRLDSPGHAGYWPDALEVAGDNLEVNPPIDECRIASEPPFLWWGLRFTDVERRNAASAGMDKALPDLSTHLVVLLAGDRSRARWRRAAEALGDAGIDAAIEAAGHLAESLSGAGLLKTAATFLIKSWGIGRDFLQDRALPALSELRLREQVSKAERVVQSMTKVLASRDDRLPLCIFADDAHFSDADPDTTDLLRRLLEAARAQRWPLLLIITHWQDRWNADASAVARWLKPQLDRIATLQVDPLSPGALRPVLAQHVPGLLPTQSAAILQRADGNPQFLEEIILFMQENDGLFQDANPHAALTSNGFAEVMSEAVERHRLNARRFRDLPRAARSALAVGSLQGQRLLQDLTIEVCAAVGVRDSSEIAAGLAAAEMPHNLLKREGRWAEFLQRLYREIAERDLRNIPLDREAVQAGIITALRYRLTQPDQLAALPPDDRRATLSLAWAALREAPGAADASLGASAAAMLIAERYAGSDYLGAGAQAQALVDAMRAWRAQ